MPGRLTARHLKSTTRPGRAGKVGFSPASGRPRTTAKPTLFSLPTRSKPSKRCSKTRRDCGPKATQNCRSAPLLPTLERGTKMVRRAEKRGIQVTEVGASDVHVRPATRADAPGIVRVSTSSILPGEDVGFGGRMDSPFHDASMLAAVWQDPNVVHGEEVLVAELDGRIVGCATVEV